MKEGIYQDLPAEEYHAIEALSSTFVKAYAQNPYAAKYKPFKGSPAAVTGSASHAYSLEGKEVFDAQFYPMLDIPYPEGQNPKGWKSTNAYKDLASLEQLRADGREILTPEQYATVLGIDKSLREHPMASQMINRGANELSLIWIDPATGMKCKARLDDYFEGAASDLKTCADVEWFHRDLYRRRYNLQAAWYSDGCVAHNLPVRYFCFLAAQTTETYPVRVGYLQPERLVEAQVEVARLAGLIKESRERNYWPNFAPPPHIHSWDQMTPGDTLEEW